MRTRMKVTDLNLRQWQYLSTNVPVDGRDFLPGLPRVCVVFELAEGVTELHVEMSAAELTGLLMVLESFIAAPAIEQVAEAMLTPDVLQ